MSPAYKHDSLLGLVYIALGQTESGADDKSPRVQCIQILSVKKCHLEIILSTHGMLSTQGKFKPQLNSLIKIHANSGHKTQTQEGAKNKVFEAKTETGSQQSRGIERKGINPSYEADERRSVCQRASAFFNSLVYFFLFFYTVNIFFTLYQYSVYLFTSVLDFIFPSDHY